MKSTTATLLFLLALTGCAGWNTDQAAYEAMREHERAKRPPDGMPPPAPSPDYRDYSRDREKLSTSNPNSTASP